MLSAPASDPRNSLFHQLQLALAPLVVLRSGCTGCTGIALVSFRPLQRGKLLGSEVRVHEGVTLVTLRAGGPLCTGITFWSRFALCPLNSLRSGGTGCAGIALVTLRPFNAASCSAVKSVYRNGSPLSPFGPVAPWAPVSPFAPFRPLPLNSLRSGGTGCAGIALVSFRTFQRGQLLGSKVGILERIALVSFRPRGSLVTRISLFSLNTLRAGVSRVSLGP